MMNGTRSGKVIPCIILMVYVVFMASWGSEDPKLDESGTTKKLQIT